MVFMFSATEPFSPTVAHMIPFLMLRLGVAPGDSWFWASAPPGLRLAAMTARPAALAFCKNSRRLIMRSCELGDSWHGHRRNRQLHVPFEMIGHEFFLGIHRLFPGHFLTGVSRHPAHERDHGALRHPMTVVHRLA